MCLRVRSRVFIQCFWARLGNSFVYGIPSLRFAGWIGLLIEGLLWRTLAHVELSILKGRLFGSFARGLQFSTRGLFRAIDPAADSVDSRRVDITAWKNLASQEGIRKVCSIGMHTHFMLDKRMIIRGEPPNWNC